MNTPSKRASAIGIGLAIRLVLPVTDGVVDQPDRQHVAYSYAGISAQPPVIPPEIVRMVDVQVRNSGLSGVLVGASRMVGILVEPSQ